MVEGPSGAVEIPQRWSLPSYDNTVSSKTAPLLVLHFRSSGVSTQNVRPFDSVHNRSLSSNSFLSSTCTGPYAEFWTRLARFCRDLRAYLSSSTIYNFPIVEIVQQMSLGLSERHGH